MVVILAIKTKASPTDSYARYLKTADLPLTELGTVE